jgi:hypothetical protein
VDRLPNGTRVIPTEPSGSTDWADPQRKDAKWGAKGIGTIVGHSDSHGLCYEVQHDTGGTGWYEAEELNLLSEPCKVDKSTATYTCKLRDLEPAELIARLAYRCPHCNKLNEMLVQPGPISLRLRCLHCDSWHEYTPTKD